MRCVPSSISNIPFSDLLGSNDFYLGYYNTCQVCYIFCIFIFPLYFLIVLEPKKLSFRRCLVCDGQIESMRIA